jgi:hypothetical protein
MNNNNNNKTLIGEINEQTDFLVDPPVTIDPPVADDDVQESEEIKTFKRLFNNKFGIFIGESFLEEIIGDEESDFDDDDDLDDLDGEIDY